MMTNEDNEQNEHNQHNDNDVINDNCYYFWSTYGKSYMGRNKTLTAKPDVKDDAFYVEVVQQQDLVNDDGTSATINKINEEEKKTKKKKNSGKKGEPKVFVTIATVRQQRQRQNQGGLNSFIRQSSSSDRSHSFSNNNSSFTNNHSVDQNNPTQHKRRATNSKHYFSCGYPSRISDSCPCTYNRSGIVTNKEIFQMIYCEDDGNGAYLFKSWNGYYLHFYESTNGIAFTRCKLHIDGLPPEKGRWELRDNVFEKGERSRWTAATGVLNYIYG